MAGAEVTANTRAALVRWEVEQADQCTLEIGWGIDGAPSAGADMADIGTSDDWTAFVYASAEAAAAVGADPLFEVAATVPEAGVTRFVAAQVDVAALRFGTFFWVGLKNDETWIKGPFYVDMGVAR